ncbi:MAG TPA: protein kinase [Bryobacteraceae bacterium]|nr:protein kinase [Bryobacteraceae bacterium]
MTYKIGRYEIQAELGRGGFGQVFRAFDPTVGRSVAVKILNAAGEPELLSRFRNEAAAAGQLRHPNIVTIFDFGEHDGTPYMVMELLEGDDLHRVIATRRPLTLVHKLEIMRQVADGLNHAHIRGIVHRDVKPANVMLLSEGGIKILDFGIALLTQAARSRVTPQGNIIGTFRYMAPEQFAGAASDQLSDIFAYGLMFYELLTGQHPFAGSEPAAVMYNIMHTPLRPLRQLEAAFPETLDQIVQRTLQRDRDERYQSLEDVIFDLNPVLQELRRQRADSLVTEAQQLVAREQIEAANSLIREILELDSSNKTARNLREVIQQHAQRKSLQPRIDSLVKTGQQNLAARNYQDAIQNLESALRLDQSNSQIRAVLEQAKAMWEQSRKVDTLLTEARHALQQRNLTGAYKSASEALQADPTNNTAAAIVAQIRAEMEARERERVLREGLEKATDLLRRRSFDEAISTLAALAANYPEAPEVKELTARAQAEKQVAHREAQLRSGIDQARSHIRASEFEPAIKLLEHLSSEFPETAELRELLAHAQRELAHQQRANTVRRIEAEVQKLSESGQLARAVKLLEESVKRIPGEAALANLLQSTSMRLRREEALSKLLADLRGMLDKGDAAAALPIARRATAEFPESAELKDLTARAQSLVTDSERRAAVRRILEETQTLASMERYDQAMQAIQQGLSAYPDDPELLAARAQTRAAIPHPSPLEVHPLSTSQPVAITTTAQVMPPKGRIPMFAAGAAAFVLIAGGAIFVPRLIAPSGQQKASAQVNHVNVPPAPVQQSGEATKERSAEPPAAQANGETPPANSPDTQNPVPEPVKPQVDPRVLAAREWDKVRATENPDDLTKFAHRYRGTPLAAEALFVRERLIARQAEARLLEVAANEWNALDKNDPAKLREFGARYGATEYGARVQSELARIEREQQFAEQKRLEAQKLAEQKKLEAQRLAEQQQREAAARTASPDLQAIRAVMARFASAFSSKNLDGIRAAWPKIPKNISKRYSNQFREPGSYEMSFRPVQDPVVNGDSASAICEFNTVTIANGARLPTNTIVRVTFRKDGGTWVIQTISQ